MIHGAPKDVPCVFRAAGKVELWDPWTGQTRPLAVLEQDEHSTRLRLPLTEHDAQLIVFSPGAPQFETNAHITTPRATIPLEGEWEFELKPTMDNRFGDFRWPPSPTFIGAEARRFRYAQETAVNPGWERPGYDDSAWATVTHSFGPKFWKLGPLPDHAGLDEQLAALDSIDPSVPVMFSGVTYRWQPFEFSWQWGVEGDPGPQGFHGLKGRVSDDFIVLGARKKIPGTLDYDYVPEQEGSGYYLWTSLAAGPGGQAELKTGGNLPAKAYLNGQPLAGIAGKIALKAGVNPLLLRYNTAGRGHVVFELPPGEETSAKPGTLAMRWTGRPGVVPFDVRPDDACPVGWYRFSAPPGLRSMTMAVRGKVQAWVDGKTVAGADCKEGLVFALPKPVGAMAKVALRIEQQRGCYGGEALPMPITLDCEVGWMPAGDWANAGVLECYSGGAWYRRTISLTPQQAGSQVTLDLGNVAATAEVHVNGQLAGIRIAPPWRMDVSRHLRPGENRIEVLVYNTLTNHYLTIPTGYRGSAASGLLGPVSLVVEPADPSR
jgi:hypothetical protein